MTPVTPTSMEITELTAQLQRLQLQHKSAVSLEKTEPHYVLDMASQHKWSNETLIAATSSNRSIRLFVRSTLTQTALLTGHFKLISGIKWLHDESDLLLTSSHDKTVRLWDPRACKSKEVQLFKGNANTDRPFLCCDVNSSDMLVCAGTSKTEDGAYIVFWDRRSSSLLGCYEESHNDDITQVQFHPVLEKSLLSGSTDGLVNVFDLEQTSEDDALISTYNTEATVDRAGWCGPGARYVYCTTHQHTWHVWDSEGDDVVQQVKDLPDRLQNTCEINYLVDCIPAATSSDDVYLVAGTHSGDLHLLDLSDPQKAKVVKTLEKGHTDTVRCLHWDKMSRTLVTGGEDSVLCLWAPVAEEAISLPHHQGKIKEKKILASNRTAPYKEPTR